MDYHVLRPLSKNVHSIRKFHPSACSRCVRTDCFISCCISILAQRGRHIEILHVCPSVRMEQLGSHGTYFREIWRFL